MKKVKKNEISEIQEKINSKYKDCFDAKFVLDIESDIIAGVTLAEIEDCLNKIDSCVDFRKCIEGKRLK